MNNDLYKNIANSSAHRASRDEITQQILVDVHLFEYLFEIALNTNNENHYKACWIMELVLQKKLHYLHESLTLFCDSLPKFKNESALRSISKICMF